MDIGGWIDRRMEGQIRQEEETRVQSLGREDLLEEEMAAHSSLLAWRIPWTGEPGGLSVFHYESQQMITREYKHLIEL